VTELRLGVPPRSVCLRTPLQVVADVPTAGRPEWTRVRPNVALVTCNWLPENLLAPKTRHQAGRFEGDEAGEELGAVELRLTATGGPQDLVP
jgi:hypothetical protein